jgi:hypothetical protein
METKKKDGSGLDGQDAMEHSCQAQDKSRNERQKAILLRHHAKLSCDRSLLLIEGSRTLAAKGERLQATTVDKLRKFSVNRH